MFLKIILLIVNLLPRSVLPSCYQDTRRLLAVAIDSIVTAPVLHAMYGLMEFFFPTSGGGFLPAATHLVLDTFVLDPVFVACFFCTTGLLESRPLKTDVLPALSRWAFVLRNGDNSAWGASIHLHHTLKSEP